MKLSSKNSPLRVVAIGATGAVVVALAGVPTPAVAASHGPVRYASVSQAPRLPGSAHFAGEMSSSKHITGAVALKVRNPDALEHAASAVSDPRSAQFRHYLPKGAFAARYGASVATIAAVETALRAGGLKVTSVSANHLAVHFSGTVADAQSAFRTHLANYRVADGRIATAPTSAVSLPASVSRQVLSVLGLNTILTANNDIERGSKTRAAAPKTPKLTHYPMAPQACPKAAQAAKEFGGLTDDQIAHAYGVDGLYKDADVGGGQTIAIYELEPFSMDDLTAFDSCYYGKTNALAMASRLSVVNIDGGAGVGPGSGESILDIDDVSGIAPGANIKVYEAPNSTAGAMDETEQIINDDDAQVVTTSWGFCELDEVNLEPGYINVGNQLYQQAALQGQTVFASSGDAGSDSCAYQSATPSNPTLSTGDPGTQPYVVGVGGTTITDAKNTPSEQVWNDGNNGGGAGGGVSSVWSAPSWQLGFNDTAAAADAVSNGGLAPCPQSADASLCRETPDVSAQADEYTGAITVYIDIYGGWNTFGGTSSSAPLWAAMLADINASNGCLAGGGVGFAGPSLYAVASVPAQRDASFNDTTVGNNDVYDLSDGAYFAAHSGYDMASGLGTPIVTGPNGQAGLAAYLCAVAVPTATPRPTVASVAPMTVETSPAGSVTITGSGFVGAKAISIGGYPVPTGGWSVTDDSHITVTTVPTAAQAGNGGGGPQDGAGRALVTVTGVSGATSPVNLDASLIYVDGTTSAPIPTVSGVSSYGGSQDGGNSVTIFGSNFNDLKDVTIGGVVATDVEVINDSTITVTVPAFDHGTTNCKSGDDEVSDICQAQVVVSNPNGPSNEAAIQPPYSGTPFGGASGEIPLPSCVTARTCEIVPASTEYDYFPTPTITSVTTTSAGATTVWASEQGDTIATIEGTGFDYLGLEWANIGNPANPDNQDYSFITETPTEIQLMLSSARPTTQPLVKPLTVQSIGGLSDPTSISYAGTPKVKGVSPPWSPDAGGGRLTVTGKGFEGVAPRDGGQLMYEYLDADTATTQLSGYTASSPTSLSVNTPGNNPGAYIVSVCTITFCSGPTSFKSLTNSLVDFYEPGDPVVTSVSTESGPASGGTKVVIHGKNLSDAVKVTFGKTVAEASSAPQLLSIGSNTEIDAVSPPGAVRSKVSIVVTTVESLAVGQPSPKTSAATFSYQESVPAPPRNIAAKAHGTSLAVTWDRPLSDGGHAITAYRVSAIAYANSPKRDAKRPAPVVTTTRSGSAKATTLRGLKAGWTYYLKVRAINKLGEGIAAQSDLAYPIHDPA